MEDEKVFATDGGWRWRLARPQSIASMERHRFAERGSTALSGKNPREDEVQIRMAAMQNRIPIVTTLRGADAALRAIRSPQGSEVQVRALQKYHS